MINEENEIVLKTYPISQHAEANNKALNKAIAFPEYGFRTVISGQTVKVIARINDKKSKLWKTMR